MAKSKYKIPDNLFKGKRNTICRILIEEMQNFKSTKKITTEEFCRLVERLYNTLSK